MLMAQDVDFESDYDREVIETEIGAEQFVPPSEEVRQAEVMATMSPEEQQLLQINQSIRSLIEENKRLLVGNKQMQEELEELRGQNIIRVNRIQTLTRQRENWEQQNRELEKKLQDHEKRLAVLQAAAEKREEDLKQQLKDMAIQMELEAQWKQDVEMPPTGAVARDENEALKDEAAKVHYNLGNIYFQQGDYEKAVTEYERAVALAPYDPEAHYNLAFVSGEYLNDQRSALKHYQQYLYLKPEAEDVLLVKEKILVARLALRTKIDSPIDTDQ
jgi:tetratricopeptide (TPR) repeat protein